MWFSGIIKIIHMPKSHICRFGIYFEHPFEEAQKQNVHKTHGAQYNFPSLENNFLPGRRWAVTVTHPTFPRANVTEGSGTRLS